MDYMFKVCLAGEGGVGKSTLIHQYLTNEFIDNMGMTIGVDFKNKKIEYNGETLLYQIWDFGGQQRFRFMLDSMLLASQAVIFVYDLTRFTTLEKLEDWIILADNKVNQDYIKIFVGNKKDIVDEKGKDFDVNPIEHFNLNSNTLSYETSSKTGENVEELFSDLGKLLVENAGDKNVRKNNVIRVKRKY